MAIDEAETAIAPASASVRIPTAEDCFAGRGEIASLMRTFDWSTTPLGPLARWPQSLCTAVNICLASRFPIVIYWGAEYVVFYNDAYREILANKHPWALGRGAREVWAEIWEIIGPMLDSVMATGEATWSDDLFLMLGRRGYAEECYFSFSFSPVQTAHGGIGGVFTAVTETTQRVLGERRLRTLHDLAARAGEAKTGEEACRVAAETLAGNPADLPFALVYLLDAEGRRAHLVGTTGLEPGTPASPRLVDVIAAEKDPGTWPLAQVVRTAQAILVDDVLTRFGPLPGGPWQESAQQALVLPLISSSQERRAGLLVAGVSPCRALDDSYRGFLELIAAQVTTAATNARAYEEERKRAEALAEVERRRAEERLRESEARYRQMFENNRAVKLLIDPNSGAIVDANPAAAEFYGYSLDGLRRMQITDLNILPPAQVAVEMTRVASGQRLTFVFRHRLASGEIRDVEVHSSPLNLQGRTLLYSIVHDITERKQLEERLRQAQKMEALGQMAGNVAHDFNHLLMLIAGYSEVLLESLEADDPRRRDADEIQKAVEQATQLTHQLLAFGRRQTDVSDTVDLNATIAQLEPLLQRLMGEQIAVSTRLAPALGQVKVERGQLEQVILNLAMNARDAMPQGGELTLETMNFELDARDVRQHAGFPPGQYVRLVVRDTGCGMDAETQSRLFEPFFTTKEPGKGTGLGLSIVYAIITQGGGHISVQSAPGHGATFLIDLPRIDAPTSTASLPV